MTAKTKPMSRIRLPVRTCLTPFTASGPDTFLENFHGNTENQDQCHDPDHGQVHPGFLRLVAYGQTGGGADDGCISGGIVGQHENCDDDQRGDIKPLGFENVPGAFFAFFAFDVVGLCFVMSPS